MSNDCGCTKKVVDKIYIENSCCGKKTETKNKCSNSCCTSCGKQIDLVDAGTYAENIYNYLENTSFGSDLVILQENDLLRAGDSSLLEEDIVSKEEAKLRVYEILETTTEKTELLIQLSAKLGFHGLKCVASLKKKKSQNLYSDYKEYTVCYVKLYEDDQVLANYSNKSKNIRTKFYVYKNDFENASIREIDLTSYSCDEVINILSQYITIEEINNKVLQILELNNYINGDTINNYIHEFITNHINEYEIGEECLFQLNDIPEPNELDELYQGDHDYYLAELEKYNDFNEHNLAFSTVRKNDGSESTSYQAFAIQNGKASGTYSIAASEGLANGEKSIALSEGKARGPHSLAIGEGSEATQFNSVAINGARATGRNSIGLQENSVAYGEFSIANLGGISIGNSSISFKGKSNSDNSITLLDSTSYCGKITVGSLDSDFYDTSYSNLLSSKCAITTTNNNITGNNIAINGGKATGQSCIAIGSFKGNYFGYANSVNTGSVAIGQDLYSGGEFSFVFGLSSEVGRYRRLPSSSNNIEWVYTPGAINQGSVAYGTNISVNGKYNQAFGENHFINGSNNFSVGSGQTTSNLSNKNLLFGNRNRIVQGNCNIAGGNYSSIINSDDKVIQGALSIGEAFSIQNLYLKYEGEHTFQKANGETGTYLGYYLCYKNLSNNFINLTTSTKLGKSIQTSNIVLRNGKKGFLVNFTFNNYKDGVEKVYPGADNIEFDLGNILIELEKSKTDSENLYNKLTPLHKLSSTDPDYNTDSTDQNPIYKCSIRILETGNLSKSSGSVTLGIGNNAEGSGSIALGYYNESKGTGSFSCGKYNDPYTTNSSEEMLLTVGNGNYNTTTLTITRKNILEVTDKDVYINLQEGDNLVKYSLNDIITLLKGLGLSGTNVNERRYEFLGNASTINLPYTIPGYVDLGDNKWYINLLDVNGNNTMSVYDPLGVIPTCNPDNSL